MTTKRAAVLAFLTILCLALPTFAKQAKTVTKGPIVIQETKHDVGPLLREIAPLLPEYSLPSEHEIPNNVNPNHRSAKFVKDTVLQTPENSPVMETPTFSLEFEGIGDANSFCNCEPPDNDGAPGTTQYVQWVNSGYEVFDKKGNKVLGPVAGNSFWTGFGGECAAENNGDPIVRFDAAAQRWVVGQFALGPNFTGPFFECVAVSQTADATGAFNRYSFQFTDFPDYPKISVWPDAYYMTFNNFNSQGTAFVGANVCAADRSKMLTGAAASIVCFQQNSNQFGMLPSDLDGSTPPAAGTPNFVMEQDPASNSQLDLFKFHVDFTTPTNSTFTGPTIIPVASYTPLCPTQQRGRCVQQPTTGSDLLESLADRLMFRLVYRNFGDHSVLLVTHSIVAGTSGGIRWYEIHNPESTPTVFQSGTFAPDSQYRWMPGIAMDSQQDIAIGFSRSGTASGQYPTLVYAGRIPSDAAGTLESEVVLKAGSGSQTGGGDRWGDYTGMAIDPVDDCTFWYTEEYQAVSGGFDWHTAVGTFSFPGCGSTTPDFTLSATNASVAPGGSGTSTVTVAPLNGFTGSVTLSVSGLPSGVTGAFVPNPTTTTSTLTLTATANAAPGTSTVTVTGVSGSLTHSTTFQLTVTGGSGPAVTLVPTSLAWGKVLVGTTVGPKTVTLTNSGTAALNFSSIAISGDFAFTTIAKSCKVGTPVAAGKTCKIKVTFTPTQTGLRTGDVTLTDNAGNSPQQIPLSGTGK